MNTLQASNDPLFELERRIAQRADELDRRFGIKPDSALEHWRQAEAEVWSTVELDPQLTSAT